MKKGKVKVEGNTISGTAEAIVDVLQKASQRLNGQAEQKTVAITAASIKEELCNYGYEIVLGPCAGDKIPNRKGSAIVHNDMIDAFAKLNVHLAIIDDAFKYSGVQLESIDDAAEYEITQLFTVTGFRINGTEENEGYIIIGDKYVTLGVIGVETLKISKSSGYTYFEELKEAIENARHEVELYMNGKASSKADQPELPFPSADDDKEFESPLD